MTNETAGCGRPTPDGGRSVRASDLLLRCLADRGRRRVLAALAAHDAPVTEDDLAAGLAAAGPGEATPAEVRTARTALGHVHLPMLAEAGLVAWDRSDGTAAATDHPVLANRRFRRLVEAEHEGLDGALAAVADGRRRLALSLLLDRDEPMAATDLARAVAARERDDEGGPTAAGVEAVLASLHHAHLPALRAAGLVEYDAATGTVAAAGTGLDEGVRRIVREATA